MSEKQRDWPTIIYYGRGIIAVVISLAILLGGAWFVYDKGTDLYQSIFHPDDDFVGEGKDEVEVLIPSGAGITQIGDILYDAGVVKSVRKFRSVVQSSGEAQNIQAGRFKLKKELPAETALAMMLDSKNQVRLWVTFPEGTMTSEQIKIIQKGFPDVGETNLTAEQITALGLPEWAKDNPEGFLFPARYVVAEPVRVERIRKDQVTEFKRVAKEINFEARVSSVGKTALEVLTVASIIEGEVHQPEYQPMVAAVIYNRLEKGMKLEMDSTVHFFAGRDGGVTTTAEQRKSDNPYNTYYHKGLPPGPINNPGKTAMSAALSPADTEALFFVTVNLDTSETKFANTYEEHLQNVAEFQQWCQANKGRC